MPVRLILTFATAVLGACAPALVPGTPRSLSETELRNHLFAFADDSMLGRRAGTEGGVRAARYLADALARAGLEPGGENGTFYQTVPLVRLTPAETSTLIVAGQPLRYGVDYVVAASRSPLAQARDAAVIFIGSGADTSGLPAIEPLRDRVVLVDRRNQSPVLGQALSARLSGAAAILVATRLDSLPAFARSPTSGLSIASRPRGTPQAPAVFYLSPEAAALVLGRPLSGAEPGHEGAPVSTAAHMAEEPLPTHNVIAILRGSDPALRDEYVVIGAHSDHVGTRSPLDHDSLRAVLLLAEARGWEIGRRLSGAERTQLSVTTDTLMRTGPRRADSVFNGADDDGSGSIIALALAESFARNGVRPRRSLLFAWHHAEEIGLLGSRHFTDHPTVPRASIVAALNLDMAGRGGATDLPGGGPRYVQVVGSRRLSSELGELVERVNASLPEPMTFDYSMDAEGHPERIYCRSDHANYARYGIPVVFFTTGLHADYHQLTDEPQYIDYGKMRRVGALTGAIALAVANAERRPMVDAPVPDPFAPCRQ